MYENLGTHDVLDHAPGEVFEDDLDPVTEARLVGGGHLKRVTASSTSGAPLFVAPRASSSGAGKQNDAETPDADDDVAA